MGDRFSSEGSTYVQSMVPILDSMPNAVVIIQAEDHCVIFTNSRAREIYGDDFRYLDFEQHFTRLRATRPDGTPFRPEEAPAMRTLIEGAVIRNVEMVIHRPDGQSRVILVSASPLRDEQGDIFAAVVSFLDITSRKQAELMSAFQSHLLESVHDAIIATDEHFHITYLNNQAEQLFGFSCDEMMHRTTQEMLHPIFPGSTREDAVRILLETGEYAGELIYHHKDGTPIAVENRARVIRDPDGKIRETVVTIRDIRARHQAEAALREHKAQLQQKVRELAEADRNKDLFLNMLSHELRNPLAAIVASLDYMRYICGSDTKVARPLEVLKRQTGHLTHLVDDLLDATRITTRKLRLNRQPVDVIELLRRSLTDHQLQIRERGIELAVDLPAEPAQLSGDPVRLTQVFDNLLQNALKFTPAGGQVAVTAESDRTAREVRIEFCDTGAGIEPEVLPHIFEPFSQAEQTLARSQGGLGLGLSIVKGMIELHGGSIEASSEGSGKGARFVLRLPLNAESSKRS